MRFVQGRVLHHSARILAELFSLVLFIYFGLNFFFEKKNRLAINWMLIGPFHSYVYGSNQHEKIKIWILWKLGTLKKGQYSPEGISFLPFWASLSFEMVVVVVPMFHVKFGFFETISDG